MSLHSILEPAIKRIFEEDKESQEGFVKVICEARSMPYFDFKKYGIFFVPNNEYLVKYCGPAIKEWSLGCYAEDDCKWSNCLVFPIYNVVGEIVGLGGFNPFRYAEAHETEDWEIYYYQYSDKRVFTKGDYLYYVGDSFDKAMDDGYLILVDGLFDAISLKEAGFNAAAMMGSSVTDMIVMQLRFIPRVILARDNDIAGATLAQILENKLKNFSVFTQQIDKDIDGALKSSERENIVTRLEKLIKDSKN